MAGTERIPGGVVAGYFDADNDGDTRNIERGPWPALETTEGPAGAIVSTAGDVARFTSALFGGKLLTPGTVRAMVAEGPHHPRYFNYGLGVEIERPDRETVAWGHGGYLPGFRSVAWYVPEEQLTIVVLGNESRANPKDLAELAPRLVRE